MKNFTIEIKEILIKEIEIDAENLEDALEIVKQKYKSEEIVLDSLCLFDICFSIKD